MSDLKENEVIVLDDIEHVLTVPSRYIGSVETKTREEYILNEKGNIDVQEITTIPAFITLLREVISNSIDEYVRTNGEFANIIDVNYKDGYFEVKDNGRGLSHLSAKNKDGESIGEPQSVVAFTRTKAGTNFKEKTSAIGQNGEGVSLVNIFSKHFIVETANGTKKTYIECKNNLSEKKYKITDAKTKFTKVKWFPDHERLHLTYELIENMIPHIKKIILDFAMCYPKIKFTFNKKILSVSSFRAYAKMYGETFMIFEHKNIDIAVFPAYDYGQISWVNGIYTRRGGTHTLVVEHNLSNKIRDCFTKRFPDMKPADVKNKLFFMVNVRNMNAPRFDSQTKEELINNTDFEYELFNDVDFVAMATSISKKKELTQNIIESFKIKEELKKRQDLDKKEKNLKQVNIDKLIETYEENREICRLYIAEGKSALMNFLTCREQNYAGYPLKGKFINCHDATKAKMIANAEVKDLLACTGLKLSSKDISELRYGKIVIFTDADYDGDAICCSLIDFFYKYWPDIVNEGHLYRAITPLIEAKKVGTKEKKYFFTMKDYKTACETEEWTIIKYNKGLGSLSKEGYTFSLDNLMKVTMDDNAKASLERSFGKNSDLRKEWLL